MQETTLIWIYIYSCISKYVQEKNQVNMKSFSVFIQNRNTQTLLVPVGTLGKHQWAVDKNVS